MEFRTVRGNRVYHYIGFMVRLDENAAKLREIFTAGRDADFFGNTSCSLESLIVALVLTNPLTWLWLWRPRTLDKPGTTNVRNLKSFAKGFFLLCMYHAGVD